QAPGREKLPHVGQVRPAAAAKPLAAWNAGGWQVQALAVNGPAFWLTVGSEDAPALIDATLEALQSAPVP
ncbi:MAG: hypothetical protein JSR53_14295, partial [Proteobacteria bacterium]|nr:hypothetical protein [Pseudomonadota bacterium]